MSQIDDQTVSARRKRLKKWIDDHFGGSQAAFVQATGVNQGELSLLLKTKSFREKRAASLEAAAGMPAGYLVFPVDAGDPESSNPPVSISATAPGYCRLGVIGEGGMGEPVVNQDFPEVIREMQFSEVQLRSIFGFLPKPGRIALMTGRGHSMEPLIGPGDVVMVDTQVNYYDEAGPYVINLGDGQQIKTLQNRGDAIYVVSLNEKVGGPPFPAPKDMIIGGKVYVVQKFVMAH